MNYNTKLQECLDAKDIVEIIAEEKVTGIHSDVGEDYISIVHAVERELTETIMTTEVKSEEQNRI